MSWRVIPLGRRGVDTVGLLIVLALSALAAAVFLLPPLPTDIVVFYLAVSNVVTVWRLWRLECRVSAGSIDARPRR